MKGLISTNLQNEISYVKMNILAQVANENLAILSKAKNHIKYAKNAFFVEKSKKINQMRCFTTFNMTKKTVSSQLEYIILIFSNL
jgi:hypothetical protein